MKAFNLKTNGAVELTTDTEQYITDVTDTAFSESRKTALDNLLTEIKSEGVTELHLEENGPNIFVHKVTAEDILHSDNVNSYDVFRDMQGYCDELRASLEGE